MPWVRGHYRRPRRSRAADVALGKGAIGCGLVVIVFGIVVALVKAVLNILATPWPWLALGTYGLYRITVRLLALHRVNCASAVVLEVVAAQLDSDELRLEVSLDRLANHADEPEAALLLAAHHLQRARFDLASAALQRLDGQDGPVISPHKLVLQFPGMVAPLSLAEPRRIREVVARLNEHIQTLMNAPAQVLVAGVNPPALERHLVYWLSVNATEGGAGYGLAGGLVSVG